MTSPLISVIIPTYNGEEYISNAIDCVLSQSYENFELLVVDDDSTDDTIEIVCSYDDSRLHIHKNEANLGIAKNMNRAVDLADGDIIAFLDQDDYWSSKKLRYHVNAHREQDTTVV
jgi:glycosyltransferase involved in cell wall biosynthesis